MMQYVLIYTPCDYPIPYCRNSVRITQLLTKPNHKVCISYIVQNSLQT